MNTNSNLDEVNALKELIAVIVDYYCFKNDDSINDNDDDDEDTFMKHKLSQNNDENQEIIPDEIDSLIQQAFKNQLSKFSN